MHRLRHVVAHVAAGPPEELGADLALDAQEAFPQGRGVLASRLRAWKRKAQDLAQERAQVRAQPPRVRLSDFPRCGRYHRLPRTIEDDYDVSETELGSGLNGKVHLATSRWAKGPQRFAAKTLCLTRLDYRRLKRLQREVEIHLSMDHPHVVRLHGVYETEAQLHLVMECMEGGELFDRVAKLRRLDEAEAADAMCQMLLAVNYMHGRGVVHRDLKLENFLYAQPNCGHLKLIDFGFSRRAKADDNMHTTLGSLPYMAPEVMGRRYTRQCDMWSMGVIGYVLLKGCMPFADSDVMAGFHVLRPQKWGRVSRSAAHFVESLLEADPEERLTAQEALGHPWLEQTLRRRESIHADARSTVAQAVLALSCTSRFRRCCMQMVAWSLSRDEHAQVGHYFLSMDIDKQGTIKLDKLEEVMCPLGISRRAVHEAFWVLDYAGSGEIQYSDFLAAMASRKRELQEELVCSAFGKFDTDSSGYITAENLREVVGDSFKGAPVEALLSEADRLGDKRISYAEFVSFLTGPSASSTAGAGAARL